MKRAAPDTEALQEKLGYRFNDGTLLMEALTHKSYHYEHPRKAPAHNERLEFLGDSVLGLAVVDMIFGLEEGLSEAMMSKIKSHVVKGKVLSEVASAMGLGGHIMVGKGEEESGGREKPSILSDCLEALIGAIYLDGGFEKAREVVSGLLGDNIHSAIAPGGTPGFRDYKTELQEQCQTRFAELPQYRLVAQQGREHAKTFTFEVYVRGELYGRGRGASKKEAQKAAAKEALKRLPA